MAGDDDIRKRFEEAIAGAELDDLRRLAPVVHAHGGEYVPRPELRKPRRREPVVYRVVVDLDGADPRIWRSLELRSDMSLDLVHAVLQGAFDWTDAHLYRFSSGGDPFAAGSQLFLCPFDVEAGEDDGVPAQEVRLDEGLRDPGDVLHYVYDYADRWDLTMRLVAVLPLAADASPARCVDGGRAAPPENCGGLRTQQDLEGILEDPGYLDIDEVDRGLLDPLLLIHRTEVGAPLIKVLQRLRHTPVAERIFPLALGLGQGERLSPEDFNAAVRPVLWFLERAQGEGLILTPAGHLTPKDVQAASEVVPAARQRSPGSSRQSQAAHVGRFQNVLRSLGLLRKHKGRLVTTRAGLRGLVEHGFLWGHIASRLVPKHSRFDKEASLMLLLCATQPSGEFPQGLFTDALQALGWRRSDGQPLGYYDVVDQMLAGQVFSNLALLGEHRRCRLEVTAVGRALAREALLWQD